MKTPRPLWRWWLFSFSLWMWWRTGWRWVSDMCGWLVLPEWLGEGVKCGEGEPF